MVRTFRKVITHINITHFIANKINADKWIFEFTKSAFDCLFKWFTNRHFILTVVYLTCNLSSSGFQMLLSSKFRFEHESTIACSSFSSKFHIGHIEFSVNQFASRFRWHDVVGCEWMESEKREIGWNSFVIKIKWNFDRVDNQFAGIQRHWILPWWNLAK